MLPTFFANIDVGSTHVYSPQPVIFVCGGKQEDDQSKPPSSIRDALIRGNVFPKISSARLFIVETITDSFLRDQSYTNFYEFENDMAQICDLVFLISESPGSFTELGSFTRDAEVARKLFAVIRNKHFSEQSYINVGPLKFLDRYHFGSVFVADDGYYNIDEADYSKLHIDLLADGLQVPVKKRMETSKEHTRLNLERNGHLCKLLVALAQEFGAIEKSEISRVFECLGIDTPDEMTARLMFCAKTVEWVRIERRGVRTFVLPSTSKRAAKLTFMDKALNAPPERRRVEALEYWRSNDGERYELIIANQPRMPDDE